MRALTWAAILSLGAASAVAAPKVVSPKVKASGKSKGTVASGPHPAAHVEERLPSRGGRRDGRVLRDRQHE